MTFFNRRTIALSVLVISGLALFACERGPKKEAKIVVTDQQFFIQNMKDKPHAYVVNAKGKVKNVGNADAKRIVITGNCVSCGEQILMGQWFTSKIEKTDAQKDIVDYIPAGGEEEFQFGDVALMYNNVPKTPDKMPDKFDVVIESFETVQ